MASRLILLVILLCTAAASRPQVKLTEKSPNRTASFTIPFTKYQLSNGLVIILHKDVSDPMAVVDVTYRVGSGQDFQARSGLAHFFEHLMFGGSRHVKDGDHMKLITEGGGRANGRTFEDRTSFTQTIPSADLEKVLWMEADRMGFLLNTINESRFELQKKAILNERRQNIENVPGGRLYEMANLHFYPPDHPYHRPSIGLEEEIQQISFADLQQFYLQWFHPGNAILTIAGNFDQQQVLQWAQKYFGPIAGRERTQEASTSLWSLPDTRYASFRDKLLNQPYLLIKFPGLPKFHADAAALDCLADILGTDRSGYLQQQLKDVPAMYYAAYQVSQKKAGEFNLFFVASDTANLQKLSGTAMKALNDFHSISRAYLQKKIDAWKTRMEFRKIYEAESLEGRVYNLVNYENVLWKAGFFHEELERYQKVTAADVLRVYNTYLKNKNALVFSYLPEKGGHQKPADTYAYASTKIQAPSSNLLPAYHEPADSFDRSVMPAPGSVHNSVLPGRHWTVETNGHVSMMGAYNNETPVVSLSIYLQDTKSPEQLKLLAYTLKDCATDDLPPQSFIARAEEHGIYFDVQAQESTLAIQVKCLKKYLPQAIALLKQKWDYSIFNENVVSASLFRLEHECSKAKANPAEAADITFRHVQYKPLQKQEVPVPCDALKNITPIGLKEYFSELKNQARLIVSGDVQKEEIVRAFSFLHDNGFVPAQQPMPVAASELPYKSVSIQHIADAQQAEVRLGYVIPEQYRYDGDMYKLLLANFILGGHFNSRLNTRLRENAGLTYRIYSYLENRPDHSRFLIATSVNTDRLQEAVSAIMQQVDSFANHGISQAELDFLKSYFGRNSAISNESDFNKMEQFKFMTEHRLPLNFAQEQLNILSNITLDELNRIIRQYINAQKFNIVIAGDKQRIQQQLNASYTK
jgi:zinc protease